MPVLAKKKIVIGKSRVTLGVEGRPTPSAQARVSGFVSELHLPGRIPGFLVARAIHSLDGTVGVFPPLEAGRLNLPLPVTEDDGSVAVADGEKQPGKSRRVGATCRAARQERGLEPSFQTSGREGGERERPEQGRPQGRDRNSGGLGAGAPESARAAGWRFSLEGERTGPGDEGP